MGKFVLSHRGFTVFAHTRSQTRSQTSGSLRTNLSAESIKSIQKLAHADEFLSRVCAVREPGSSMN